MWLIQRTVKMVSYISGVAINLSRSDSKSWIFAPASLTCFDNSILSFFSCNKSKELVRFGPIKKLFFVCGHRQKTKELLELLLFFSICLISYLKEIIAKKKSSRPGIKPGSMSMLVKHSINLALVTSIYVTWKIIHSS